MEEYLYKLELELKHALVKYLEKKDNITLANKYDLKVGKIDSVSLSVSSEEIRIDLLLSGQVIAVGGEGEVTIWEKIEGGETRKRIEFWLKNSTVKYNLEKRNFEIIDLGEFLALNFMK